MSGARRLDEGRYHRSLVLSNQVSVILFVISLAIWAAFYLSVPENTLMVNWLGVLSLTMASALLWNRIGFFQLSQFIISTGLPLILLFSTIQSKLVNTALIHEGSYYNPRYFLIGLCFIPFVIYDLRQRSALGLSLFTNVAILIFYDPIHRFCGAGAEQIMGHPIENDVFVSVASSSAGLAIVAGMMVLKSANARYERRIETLLEQTREQNDELNAGIRYAQRLQASVLPSKSELGMPDEQIAVFFSPKDTLSGDFYFGRDYNGVHYVSVVDCTGHGVPGAFVSLMAHKALTESLEAHARQGPAATLTNVQERIHRSFASTRNGIQDGMDLTLCRIDHEKKEVCWAGARGMVWLLSDGELIPLKSERRSIGDENTEPFSEECIAYASGDLLFLTSDGFPDQFGGGLNKKFGRKRLRQMFRELDGISLPAVEARLRHRFEAWKEDEEQTDDVCVMVVRLP